MNQILTQVLDILKNEFKCPICMDQYDQPVITKCGHSFCYECLNKSSKGVDLQCPLCKSKLNIRNVYQNKKIEDLMLQIKQIRIIENSQSNEILQNSVFKIKKEEPFISKISNRNSNSSGESIVILTSVMNFQLKEEIEKFKEKFTCKVVETFDNKVTHLVVGYDDNKYKQNMFYTKRTMKYLKALVNSKWIVSFNWIKHSVLSHKILEEEDFEIQEDGYGKLIPKKSRLNSENMKQLFKDIKVYFADSKNSKELPVTIEDLGYLLESTGCQISKIPTKDCYFIKITNPYQFIQQSKQLNRDFISHLWILDSISNFSVLDVDKYKI